MPCCIVFILDNSGSMSTRAHSKFSFFDIAKNYIETFIKGRSKSDGRQAAMGRDGDRYYLLTTSSKYPENVKVLGEKVPFPVLEEIKKMVMPHGANPVHHAILDAFRLMHVNRTMTGIDAYGSGRAPQNTEQVLIILLTDGSGAASIPNDFKLQFEPAFLGSEMTKEAFRWDQKFFSVVFRIPSTPYKPTTSQLLTIDIDMPNIEKLCSVTGGRSFSIVSNRQINTSIEQILSYVVLHRIGVRFDCLNIIAGKQTNEEVVKLRARFKKILEKRPVTNLISRVTPQGRPVTCHWQIPESYFPVKNMDFLPPRLAHPLILLGTEAISLNQRNDLPFDKLEVEPSGVTDIVTEMLQGKKELAVPAYISNSSNGGGNTVPFGCLRLNSLGNGINLILLPFNYPVLYQLIEDVKDPSVIMNPQWRGKLDAYLQSIPFYCLTTTRQALEKFKIKADVSSSMSSTYAAVLLSNLNRLKMKGKEEYDNIALASKLSEPKENKMHNPMIRIERITSRSTVCGLNRLSGEEETEEGEVSEMQPIYSGEFQIPLYPPCVAEPVLDTVYRSPWTSSLEDMVQKLSKMQANVDLLFNPSKPTLLDMAKMGVKARFNNLEELHNLPLKTMGEYEPYQMARVKFYGPPLKKIEEEKERTHAFGNPYKLKSFGAGIDEVMDSAIVDTKREGKRDGESRMGGGPPKRKRGPLGIDAFEKWRTRRSMSGSSAPSSIADIMETDDEVEEVSMQNGTTNGFHEREEEKEERLDDANGLVEKIEEVTKMMGKGEKFENEEKSNSNLEMVQVPVVNGKIHKNGVVVPSRRLSSEEMLSKKLLIGQIVRRPANNRAFEDILNITADIGKECMQMLIRFAVRESRRFKQKTLTERLEQQLSIC